MHPQFLIEPQNIRLGLCINGFNSFESFVALYSCWLVILIVYNLPLGICMKLKLMQLPMVILGRYSLGMNINIYL